MEYEEVLTQFEAAKKRLDNGGKGLTKAEGGSRIQRVYADLYQKMVQMGKRQQIKKKYRG